MACLAKIKSLRSSFEESLFLLSFLFFLGGGIKMPYLASSEDVLALAFDRLQLAQQFHSDLRVCRSWIAVGLDKSRNVWWVWPHLLLIPLSSSSGQSDSCSCKLNYLKQKQNDCLYICKKTNLYPTTANRAASPTITQWPEYVINLCIYVNHRYDHTHYMLFA